MDDILRDFVLTASLISRPILSSPTGRPRFGGPTTPNFSDFGKSGIPRVSFMLFLLLVLRSGSRLSMGRGCARRFDGFPWGVCIIERGVEDPVIAIGKYWGM